VMYIVVGLNLVVLREEDGGDGPVGLGDDPDGLLSYRVGADDAPSVLQGPLVLSLVVGVQIAPIPRPMAGQVTKGILADFLQEF
jgi:hypothetical protein